MLLLLISDLLRNDYNGEGRKTGHSYVARPPCRSLGQGWLIASREGLTLIGLLHPRRPGKHGAAVCTLQVQEQDLDHAMEKAERKSRNERRRRRSRTRGRSRSRSRTIPSSCQALRVNPQGNP